MLGQPIPSGLHIRYNFETKVTEAKLMDKDENDNKSPSSLAIHPEALVNDEDDNLVHNNEQHSKLKLSLEELKTRLKKIKTDANSNMKQVVPAL